MKSRRTRDNSRLKSELLVHSAEISPSLARSVLSRLRHAVVYQVESYNDGGQGSKVPGTIYTNVGGLR